ncbi:hypothetical protein MBLNU459_g3519t2 [Dothideomycetes sp. NU459]
MPSDEVALDFKDALQDLSNNNRFEISNLTIIAKENTEHAQAISAVLEQHIKTTAPIRKLPALYVLDSIVKNVGTPYTVYLGKNLFSTFMDAYTLVEPNTRKSMEGMLKTWKEPVPGSIDPRPVFAPEVTRVIENALIKARTVMQQSRNQRTPLGMPQRPMSSAFRNTPTPPQNGSRYPPPPQNPYQNGFRSQQPTPQQFFGNQPIPDIARLLAGSVNPQQQELNMLKDEIQSLIAGYQSEFAKNPFDSGVQSVLKALLDLQLVMANQTLSSEAISTIKAQIAGLRAGQPPPPASYAPPPSVQPTAPALPAFAPGVLESLLASTAKSQKPSTPIMQAALPALQTLAPATQSPQSTAAAAAPAATGNPLIDALRAAGLVQGTTTPTPAANPPLPPAANPAATLLQQLQGLAPQLSNINGPAISAAQLAGGPPPPRFPLSAPNLKSFRPELIQTLYDGQPNQCTTCGRRFLATEEGRAKKSRHLDWHFRTNQRIADAAQKGQNRSWYIDEMEWISLDDIDVSAADEATANDAAASSSAAVAAAGKSKNVRDSYIAAPTGAAANASCPICQERFDTVWHDEAQEWVWMDAVKVGGRAFHASCHHEVTKGAVVLAGGVGQRGRSATPESVLGKRKADADLSGLAARLKREAVA